MSSNNNTSNKSGEPGQKGGQQVPLSTGQQNTQAGKLGNQTGQKQQKPFGNDGNNTDASQR